MSLRVYLPTTLEDLRSYVAGREIPEHVDRVVADGEDEESEYSALMTAADLSAGLLGGPGRRVVVVAVVPEVARPVPMDLVVAVHADPEDRPADADPDDDLAWYASQEIAQLLRD